MVIGLIKKCSTCDKKVLEGKFIGLGKRDPEAPTCTNCLIQYSKQGFNKLPDYQNP